jgi:CheY-like chemotaxis protein
LQAEAPYSYSLQEVFRLLRDDPRTRNIPVIVLSADAVPSRMRRLLDAESTPS